MSFAKDADGKWGYKVGADAVIPFKSGGNMKAVVTFTGYAQQPAGYTTVFKNEEKFQSLSFNYSASEIPIALGFLSFIYNNGIATIKALHDCTVNDIYYIAGETVATLKGFSSFPNYTYTINL